MSGVWPRSGAGDGYSLRAAEAADGGAGEGYGGGAAPPRSPLGSKEFRILSDGVVLTLVLLLPCHCSILMTFMGGFSVYYVD